VGLRVRETRIKKGLSQSQLGAPFFTRAMVSAVELGKISPALKTLAHFASKLEVPLKDLIPD
jgi:transcriptional regulator with XRE-family HTH domain